MQVTEEEFDVGNRDRHGRLALSRLHQTQYTLDVEFRMRFIWIIQRMVLCSRNPQAYS